MAKINKKGKNSSTFMYRMRCQYSLVPSHQLCAFGVREDWVFSQLHQSASDDAFLSFFVPFPPSYCD